MILAGRAIPRSSSAAVADAARGRTASRQNWEARLRALVAATALGVAASGLAGSAAAAPAGPQCDVARGDEAIEACNLLIASGRLKGAKLAAAYAVRCRLLSRTNETDRAVADCTEAIRIDPRLADALNTRGVVWSNVGDYDRAIADYDQAIGINPRNPLYFTNRGMAWRGKRDYDRAVTDYDRAIALDPKYTSAYFNRALVYRNRREFDRAIADSTEAIRLDPNLAAAYETRAHALRNKGEYDRAIGDYGKAIRLEPREAIAYAGRGLTWLEMREFDRAIADLTESIRLDPNRDAAYTNRGLAFERKGDRETARADFRMALARPGSYGDSKWAQDTARERLAILSGAPPFSTTQPVPAFASPQPSAMRPEPRASAKDQSLPAGPAPRMALVIANASYPDADPPLHLPTKDARALADELKRSGFEVEFGENLTKQQLVNAIAAFKKKIRPGATLLMFYSGYAVQAGHHAHMIPVDAQVWSERDVHRDGISIEQALGEVSEQGAGVKLVIVDAARRNPFERRFRSASAGLGPIVAPNNTLVIYSAGLGQVVNESRGEQSLFMREFLKELRAPGISAEEAFTRTRIDVSRASETEQVPWVSSSLLQSFAFGPAERQSDLESGRKGR
jgi:tetratricopeptide (TPR) repeat protein